MEIVTTHHVKDYINLLKNGYLTYIYDYSLQNKIEKIIEKDSFELVEWGKKLTEKNLITRMNSLVIYIGQEKNIQLISDAYSSYKGSKYVSVPNLDALERHSDSLSKAEYITFIIDNTVVSDSTLQYIDKFTRKMCSKLISFGVISYDNEVNLAFQIFKLNIYPLMSKQPNYLIAHNNNMKNPNHFDFFKSSVGIFPYKEKMNLFSFQGHGREDYNFIYNGYLCSNDDQIKKDVNISRIPHWKKDPKYYYGKKDFVYANNIQCRIALINSCTSFTLGEGAYTIGDSISEGFKKGYAAVTVGNNIIRDGNSIENIIFEKLFSAGCSVGEAVAKLNYFSYIYQFDSQTFHIAGDPEFTLYKRDNEAIKKINQNVLDMLEELKNIRKKIEANFVIIDSFNNLRYYGINDRKILNLISTFKEHNISILKAINIQNIHNLNMDKVNKEIISVNKQKEKIFGKISLDLAQKTKSSNYQFSETYHEYSKIDNKITNSGVCRCPYCNKSLYRQCFKIIPTGLERSCFKCHDCGVITDFVKENLQLVIKSNVIKTENVVKIRLCLNNQGQLQSMPKLICEFIEGNRYDINLIDTKIIENIIEFSFSFSENTPRKLFDAVIYVVDDEGISSNIVPVFL